MADQEDGAEQTPARVPDGAPAADDAAEALSAAKAAVDDLSREAASAAGGEESAAPLELPAFPEHAPGGSADTIDLLADVSLSVKIELGRTSMLLEDVLRLAEGAVVELDKLAGDPVDIYVNNRPVARGEVLVMNDNFCVRVHEILSDTAQSKASVTRGAR
jgi:flagellar motor switch protein FliN/FliY